MCFFVFKCCIRSFLLPSSRLSSHPPTHNIIKHHIQYITHTHTHHSHTHTHPTHNIIKHHIQYITHTHTHVILSHTSFGVGCTPRCPSGVLWSPPLCRWLLRGRRGTWCTAKRSDVRPRVPPVSLGLRRSAGGFCAAGVGLGRCTAKGWDVRPGVSPVSLRCPLVSAALPVALLRGRVYAPVSLRCPSGGVPPVSLRCPSGVPQCPSGVPPVSLRCPSGLPVACAWQACLYGVPWSPPLCRWLLRGRRGAWCTAKGSDVRPSVRPSGVPWSPPLCRWLLRGRGLGARKIEGWMGGWMDRWMDR